VAPPAAIRSNKVPTIGRPLTLGMGTYLATGDSSNPGKLSGGGLLFARNRLRLRIRTRSASSRCRSHRSGPGRSPFSLIAAGGNHRPPTTIHQPPTTCTCSAATLCLCSKKRVPTKGQARGRLTRPAGRRGPLNPSRTKNEERRMEYGESRVKNREPVVATCAAWPRSVWRRCRWASNLKS